MSDGFEDMPNQRPNYIGKGLADLAAFFSDNRVDQGKLYAMAGTLQKRGVTAQGMHRIVTTAMEECERFPALSWMLKLLRRRKSDSEGWGSVATFCTPKLDAVISSHERRWLAERNIDIWNLRNNLSAGVDANDLLDKWRLYLDHNFYVRQAPTGDLVRTTFESRDQVAVEMQRVGYTIPIVTQEDVSGGLLNCKHYLDARDATYNERRHSKVRRLFS